MAHTITLTSKRQATLPVQLCREMGVQPGDVLVLERKETVVQEVWHALCHHYQVPVREAAGCLMDFLASGIVAGTGHALSVLQGSSGSGPGVTDRIIRRDYLDHASSILTLDKEFSKLSHVKAL